MTASRQSKLETKTSNSRPGGPSSAAVAPPNDALLSRLVVLVARKSYEEAANLLRTAPRSPWITNALGVCLMRCGRTDEALQVYRSLVLNPGTTVLRHDADDLMRINFATALLLKGTPSGAMDVLAELHELNLEPANQLRDAIRRWSKSLPWWRRFEWTFNRIDPPNSRVPLEFEPGVLSFTVQRKGKESPSKPVSPDLAA